MTWERFGRGQSASPAGPVTLGEFGALRIDPTFYQISAHRLII
jgi:hypothetical protein